MYVTPAGLVMVGDIKLVIVITPPSVGVNTADAGADPWHTKGLISQFPKPDDKSVQISFACHVPLGVTVTVTGAPKAPLVADKVRV